MATATPQDPRKQQPKPDHGEKQTTRPQEMVKGFISRNMAS